MSEIPFSLDRFKTNEPPEVPGKKQATPRGRPRRGEGQARGPAFVAVPLEDGIRMAVQTGDPRGGLRDYLLYLAWKTKSRTFLVPSQTLRRCGVSKNVKVRYLKRLHTTGWIVLELRPRKSPQVTLVDRPGKRWPLRGV